jgi:3-oxoacyl-[acyl-carrier-protein] synthase-3
MSERNGQGNNMIGVSMIGIGACVPKHVVTNEDLSKIVETSDEWIVSRTGIRERRVVTGNETVADLAIVAAREALASAGIDGIDVDLIIVASSTPDTIYPAVSCQVQQAIGAVNAAGFDMALACTGFTAASIVAYQFLKNGMYKTALVIGADIHSRYTDWEDRNTCILFGDGAGAAILQGERGRPDDYLANEMRLDGSKGMELTLYTSAPNCPMVAARDPMSTFVYMNGKEVFKFAVSTVPKSIDRVVSEAGLKIEDIDHLVLHQANIRIMQTMTEKLGIPEEKMVVNLDRYGNTSAASIPIALNEAQLEGRLKPGDLVVLCGFGAGLAWATSVIKWACVDKRVEAGKTAKELEPQLV